MPDSYRDSITHRLGTSAGYLFWDGRKMENEGTQNVHSRIEKVDGEAVGGVHVQINLVVGAKLSATGREGEITRAVSRELAPV